MKKLHYFVLMLILPLHGAEKSYRITEECHENIKKINKDGGVLFYFLQGSFEEMGKRVTKEMQVKPSAILTYLVESGNINKATNLQYMSATDYLGKIISKEFPRFDEDFKKKHEELKDDQACWKWFVDYFKEEGIIKPLNRLKFEMVKEDEENLMRVEFEDMGVFVSDKKVVYDPRRARN